MLVLAAGLAAGCAGTEVAGASDDGAVTGGPDGGLPVVDLCTDMINDAPVTHPSCAESCGCAVRGTTPLVNGTYVLTDLVNYTQDCTALSEGEVKGKLRVMGNVMEVIMQQPAGAIGDTITSRMRYTFQLSGGTMNVQWTCPPSDGGVPSQAITYASDGRSVHFTILPGTHGDSVFVRQ